MVTNPKVEAPTKVGDLDRQWCLLLALIPVAPPSSRNRHQIVVPQPVLPSALAPTPLPNVRYEKKDWQIANVRSVLIIKELMEI